MFSCRFINFKGIRKKKEGFSIGTFSENQIEAIKHNEGPMLVLAGPGSGKTTVITHRVHNLINEYKVNPENILVITYTKAAALSMEDRYEKLNLTGKKVYFGTFHSVFFNILKYTYGYKNDDICSEADKYKIIKAIIRKKGMDYEDGDEFIRDISSEMGYVKNKMLSINSYKSTHMRIDDFRKIYVAYNDYIHSKGKLDFDDMLVFTYRLFEEKKDVLSAWQERFKYILIDEFQDINLIQYMIVKQLSGKYKNVFAVGDDDQSVYSFRGATPDLMKQFSKEYKDVKICNLDINYRCGSEIVDVAGRLIKNNKNRFDKNIKSAFVGERNARVHILEVKNQKEQCDSIIRHIKAMSSKGIKLNNIAILFRTNTESRTLVSRLIQANIPFRVRDVSADIFSHFIAKNIFDYMDVARGNRSRGRLVSIINKPNRYISREILFDEIVDLDEIRNAVGDKPIIQKNIDTFENDLKRIAIMKPYVAINYIRHAIGYEDYLKKYAEYKGTKKEDYLEILDELQESAREYDTYEEWLLYIKRYKAEIKKQSESRNYNREEVCLTTMHSAKGLEYDHVFIVNAVEEFCPHKKSVLPEEIEEERRMFYVAITRAKYGLYIYIPENIYSKKCKTSRFVQELKYTDEFDSGDVIIHKRYGKGTITYANCDKIHVHFADLNIEKVFSVSYICNNKLISKEI